MYNTKRRLQKCGPKKNNALDRLEITKADRLDKFESFKIRNSQYELRQIECGAPPAPPSPAQPSPVPPAATAPAEGAPAEGAPAEEAPAEAAPAEGAPAEGAHAEEDEKEALKPPPAVRRLVEKTADRMQPIETTTKNTAGHQPTYAYATTDGTDCPHLETLETEKQELNEVWKKENDRLTADIDDLQLDIYGFMDELSLEADVTEAVIVNNKFTSKCVGKEHLYYTSLLNEKCSKCACD